jgi:hypothetical protein
VRQVGDALRFVAINLHRERSVSRRCVRSRSSASKSGQRFENLALSRESSLVAFREDLFPIDRHDEDASAAADDLAVDRIFSFDLSRQTGGSGEVVSNAAVVDSNVHGL